MRSKRCKNSKAVRYKDIGLPACIIFGGCRAAQFRYGSYEDDQAEIEFQHVQIFFEPQSFIG